MVVVGEKVRTLGREGRYGGLGGGGRGVGWVGGSSLFSKWLCSEGSVLKAARKCRQGREVA